MKGVFHNLNGILKEMEGLLTRKYQWKRGSKYFSSRQQQALWRHQWDGPFGQMDTARLQELTDLLQICFLKAGRLVLAIISYDKILLMASSGSTWGGQLLGGVKNLINLSLECRSMSCTLKILFLLWSCCLTRWSILHYNQSISPKQLPTQPTFLTFFLQQGAVGHANPLTSTFYSLLKARN